MALIAEEVVEEWLNRKGYFTIRGAKNGLYEADILAIKPDNNPPKLKHFEISVSYNPMGYIGGNSNAKKRSSEEIVEGVNQWIEKKFYHRKKVEIRDRLVLGEWKYCVVFGKLRHPEEQRVLLGDDRLSEVHSFNQIVDQLKTQPPLGFTSSANELVNLILMSNDLGFEYPNKS